MHLILSVLEFVEKLMVGLLVHPLGPPDLFRGDEDRVRSQLLGHPPALGDLLGDRALLLAFVLDLVAMPASPVSLAAFILDRGVRREHRRGPLAALTLEPDPMTPKVTWRPV